MLSDNELVLAKSYLLNVQESCPSIQIYLFGSFLKEGSMSSDIDVLVVCADRGLRNEARTKIEKLNHIHPVDLLIMSPSEESELDFIASQEALSIIDAQQGGTVNKLSRATNL